MRKKPTFKSVKTKSKIEKGIPVPEGRRHGNSKLTVFDKLEVGDSYLFPYDEDPRIKEVQINSVATRANYWKMRNPGKNLTCRSVEDGIRVWRIE